MQFNRYGAVLALVSIVALVVGCTALGGRDQRPRATAIVIPHQGDQSLPAEEGKTQYPPQCDVACQKIWDKMSPEERTAHLITQVEVSDQEIDYQKRRADIAVSAASASQGGCKTAQPKPAAKKQAKPCGSTTVATPAPAASVASQPALAIALPAAFVASVPAFKLADPVTERRVSKEVGVYNDWNVFGYRDGFLLYRPYPLFGFNKSVYVTQQIVELSYECAYLRVPETDMLLKVKVAAAVNPSLLWEADYHRLVAIYGAIGGLHANKDVVTAEDVKKGVERYIGQHQEALCRLASAKSLNDILQDPSLGSAEELNRYFRRDAGAAFDVLVQTTEVDLSKDDYRVIALKARTK